MKYRTKIGLGSVYIIENTATNDAYVGASRNVNPMARPFNHFGQLMSNAHPCKLLQDAWNTSRLIDWVVRVLEAGIRDDELHSRETYWINSLGASCNTVKEVPRARDTTQEMINLMHGLHEQGFAMKEIARVIGCSSSLVSKTLRRIELGKRHVDSKDAA